MTVVRRVRLRRVALAGVLALGTLTAACSGGTADSPDAAPLALDGTPRTPDDEGIATRVSRTDIVIGDRTYGVSPELQVVSGGDLQPTPLARWQGAYVQVGVRDDVVVWLVGVARVFDGSPPTALVTGVIDSLGTDMIVLEGGTVLTVDPSVDLSTWTPDSYVIATIDADRGVVIELSG